MTTATLHNEEKVARKDVLEGDIVVARRAGDVLPEAVALAVEVIDEAELLRRLSG